MGKHTPEPWQTGREDLQSYHGHSGEPFSSIYRRDDDERMPLTTDGFGGLTRVPLRIAYIEGKDIPREEEKANARRIVACVNACTGMSDPDKEIKALRDVYRLAEKARKTPPRPAPSDWFDVCKELNAALDALAALKAEGEVKSGQ